MQSLYPRDKQHFLEGFSVASFQQNFAQKIKIIPFFVSSSYWNQTWFSVPLNFDNLAVMMLYDITVPAAMAWSMSRRENQTRSVSLLVALVALLAICTHMHGHIWITILLLSAWHIIADAKQDLAANSKFLKSFCKDYASSLLSYCLAKGHSCFSFGAKGWNQAGEGTEMLRSCAKSTVHLSLLYCSGRPTLNKILL